MIRYHSAYPWHDKVSQSVLSGLLIASHGQTLMTHIAVEGRVSSPDEAGGLRAREVGAAVQQVRSVHKGEHLLTFPSILRHC